MRLSVYHRFTMALLIAVLLQIVAIAVKGQDAQRIDIPLDPVASTAIDPSILDYGAVKDTYGGRIAARYLAVQLDVENLDARPYWLRGVTFGFDPSQCDAAKASYPSFDRDRCLTTYNNLIKYPSATAPTDQRILIAVSQMGAIQSRRAQVFRLLDFAFTIAPVFAPFLNVTQASAIAGAGQIGLPALEKLFPDFSGQQLRNLADQSYRQGIIVGPKQSESFIVFIPADRVFDRATWDQYKASAQKQDGAALELKQFLQMVLMLQTRGDFITVEVAPVVTSNSLQRRQ